MKIRILFLAVLLILLVGCEKRVRYGTIDESKVVSTFGNVYEYAEGYPDTAALVENSDCIVYGEVIDIQYIALRNGVCSTEETVRVLKSIKGSNKAGTNLCVYKLQGYLSVKDYLDSFDKATYDVNRADFKQYSDSALTDIYVKQISRGDVMSEEGQKGIYFLKRSDSASYYRLNEGDGEYIEMGENQFYKMSEVEYAAEEANYKPEPQSLENIVSEIADR